MNPDLYEAAAKGEIEHFSKLATDERLGLGSIMTHKMNTVLHVHIIASHTQNEEGERVSTKFVGPILEMCPSLLLQVNSKGDAPLHVAAKCRLAAVVGALIEFAKRHAHQELESGVESTAELESDVESTTRHMLGMKNDEENTALHEAVQSGSLDVVEIFLKAGPDFPYSANASGETPLYLAAARGHKKIVAEILEKCPSPAHEGPSGKTALHAAVCSGSYGAPTLLLDKQKSWTRERDRYGWTPLHYAAYSGDFFMTELLLEYDKSLALIPDKDRKMTALHLAAGQGNHWTVEYIIDIYPECCEMVDSRGWNILHFAMVSFYASDLKRLLSKYPVVKNLIIEKDENGNTPFHVLAAVYGQLYNLVPRKLAKSYYQAVNKQNISVDDIYRYGFPELKQEIKQLSEDHGSGQYPDGVLTINKKKEFVNYWFWEAVDEEVFGTEKASEYHLVVAALIATVTFAAAFTLPGGYIEDGPNRGTAVLSKNAAFQAFVISDAIAMVFSLSAVFLHFLLSLKIFKRLIFLFVFALSFTLVAMAAMMVAFVTGTYAMLAPSVWLAIVTCIIGMTFFLLVIFIFCKVISEAEGEELISKLRVARRVLSRTFL